jgi:hypothetical protein
MRESEPKAASLTAAGYFQNMEKWKKKEERKLTVEISRACIEYLFYMSQ